MIARRVVRRVASRWERRNGCPSSASVESLETKVLQSCLPFFPGPGRGSARFAVGVGSRRRQKRGSLRSGSCLVGVWYLLSPACARRVAWTPAPRPTPFLTSSLATKERKVKVRK
jgi:hypothetical protein